MLCSIDKVTTEY